MVALQDVGHKNLGRDTSGYAKPHLLCKHLIDYLHGLGLIILMAGLKSMSKRKLYSMNECDSLDESASVAFLLSLSRHW